MEEQKGCHKENYDVEDIIRGHERRDTKGASVLVPKSTQRVLDLIGLILWHCNSCNGYVNLQQAIIPTVESDTSEAEDCEVLLDSPLS